MFTDHLGQFSFPKPYDTGGFFLFIFILGALCSCNQDKVRHIPISNFFKNAEESFFKISPDGKYVSYLKPYKSKQNLFIKTLADGKEIIRIVIAGHGIKSR